MSVDRALQRGGPQDATAACGTSGEDDQQRHSLPANSKVLLHGESAAFVPLVCNPLFLKMESFFYETLKHCLLSSKFPRVISLDLFCHLTIPFHYQGVSVVSPFSF